MIGSRKVLFGKIREKRERCQAGDERDIDLRWEWETGSGPPLATVKEGTKKREMLDVEKYCLGKTLMLFSTKDLLKMAFNRTTGRSVNL